MRKVMCNWEVAEKWGKQEEARGHSGNFWFKGPNLYSYGTKVGYICKNGIRLVTAKKYSRSTTYQLNDVKRDFEVLFLGETEDEHKGNVEYYLAEMKKKVMEFSNCRSRDGRLIVERNNELHEELKRYCETFGLKMPVTLGLFIDPESRMVKEFMEKRFYKPDPEGWREIFLPKWLADKDMDNVEAKDLLKTRNAEIRREIINLLGIESVCEELGATTIDRQVYEYDVQEYSEERDEEGGMIPTGNYCKKQSEYELILLDLRDGRRRPFLKMRNPSVEAWHIEGVHPCLTTVQDALNYRRYGMAMLELKTPDGFSWHERAEFSANPENWQIKEEYMTSKEKPNEKDWRPVQLT